MGSTLLPVASLMRCGRPGSRTLTFVVWKFYFRHHPKFFIDTNTLTVKNGKDIKTEKSRLKSAGSRTWECFHTGHNIVINKPVIVAWWSNFKFPFITSAFTEASFRRRVKYQRRQCLGSFCSVVWRVTWSNWQLDTSTDFGVRPVTQSS